MKITAIASAFPAHDYAQETITGALKLYWTGQMERPSVLAWLHGRVGVDSRHLAFPLEQYPRFKNWGEVNNAWIDVALQLGQQAFECCLRQASLTPAAPSAIFFNSITGIASPSIDARLINRMGLPLHIKRVPIFGLGCVAGAAGLARAADYVRAFPDQYAALVAVEVCSLTWQRDDTSVANLISCGLFGDGASVVLIGGAETPGGGPRILGTQSSFYPDTEPVMGWDISETGFKIVLSPEVPDVVRRYLAGDVDGFLAQHGLKRSDIGTWIMHTGGPKVLEAMAEALDLPEGALDASWQSLRQHGNISSVSVLLVLEEFMRNRRPAPGSYSVLAAMGPGFCAELLLLQW